MLIFIIFTFSFTIAKAADFTEDQINTLNRAYELGKPFNFGYTMAAIAWKESSAGLRLVNLKDPSAGVFHNTIRSVMGRHPELKNTNENRSIIMQRLVEDMDFSAAEALSELEFWKSEHGATAWTLIWQSYNGGYWALKPETKGYRESLAYSKDINKKVAYFTKNNFFME